MQYLRDFANSLYYMQFFNLKFYTIAGG